MFRRYGENICWSRHVVVYFPLLAGSSHTNHIFEALSARTRFKISNWPSWKLIFHRQVLTAISLEKIIDEWPFLSPRLRICSPCVEKTFDILEKKIVIHHAHFFLCIEKFLSLLEKLIVFLQAQSFDLQLSRSPIYIYNPRFWTEYCSTEQTVSDTVGVKETARMFRFL